MIKVLLLIIGCVMSAWVGAADIYGLSDAKAKQVLKKYQKEIAEFEQVLQRQLPSFLLERPDVAKDNPSSQPMKDKKRLFIKQLKQDYGFLFVDLQFIFYPDEDKFYSAIEVIDAHQPERLSFLDLTSHDDSLNATRTHPPDLIESMITYNQLGLDLLVHHDIDYAPCPVFHCIAGFTHTKLKPYLTMFNEGVVKEKAFILETLAHDPDVERRGAAVYLLGHLQDPHEILSLLMPYVEDKSKLVRNNVMRVIGTTTQKANISQVDVMPFLKMLDSPYASDRNKALLVLMHISESHASKQLILRKGGLKLLALLKLKQPNNHDWAYLILKKVSGEHFGEHDIKAWKHWLGQSRHSAV